MTATKITIDALEKSFSRGSRKTVAVDHVNLSIEPGEIFFLLGPSGCGKTTLLRMIAGFIEPTSGRTLFDSEDVTWLAPHLRRVGMVFQSYALWPHMTVEENVAFGLRVQGKDDIARRVKSALEIVQMGEYGERRPNELSGGQQQRVALARALVVEPRVLLLDEPLSNLDAKLRSDLRAEIRRVCKQAGTTTIYVTHDQKEALAIADRIAVLKSGKTCQVGAPRELYDNPSDTFVAGFLGEVNLLACTSSTTAGQGREVRGGFGVLRSTHVSASKDRIASIGVRPECVRVRPTSGTGLQGVVESAMFLGESQQLYIKLGEDRLKATVVDRVAWKEGDRCEVMIDPADVMCFG
jgi:iron(III) transport system ATP-binding protein